jgi:hypothetical protein
MLLQLPADLTQRLISFCSCRLSGCCYVCVGDVAGAQSSDFVLLQLLQARRC